MAEPMVTYSGRQIVLTHITPQDIVIEDIAHALSLVCRAGGHIRRFYSVGQHCLNCADEAKARDLSLRVQLACLLHDGGEAYLTDLIRPAKALLPDYRALERQVDLAVRTAFGLEPLSALELDQVVQVDNAMLHHEFLLLRDDLVIYPVQPPCLSAIDCSERLPSEVERAFLSSYERLAAECRH